MRHRPLTAAEAMSSRVPPDLESARHSVCEQGRLGWRARDDRDAWPFVLPFDWSSDPFVDANWRFQVNCWRPLDVWLNLHSLTQDIGAYRALVAGVLDWRDHEAAGGDQGVLWGDMSTGIRSAKLAYVLSQQAFAELPEDQQADITHLARRHLARLSDPGFISTSNHALAQIHGAMALIQIGPDWPEAQGGKAYIARLLDTALANQFGTEGMHLEHSPGYHLFAVDAFGRLLASGWHDSPELQRIVDLARRATPWLVMPDGHGSAIGDSSPRRVSMKPPATGKRFVSKLFREAGYGVVRTNWDVPARRGAMLLVTCGFHSIKHKHADDLSFELFEGGRRLFVDTGKYTYSPGAMRDFGKSPRAHNSIDLLAERQDNGLEFSKARDVARGATPPSGGGLTRLDRLDWGWIIEGAFERAPFGVAHRRRFLYRPREWLVLLDEVTADRKRDLTAWLHPHPDVMSEKTRNGWTLDAVSVTYVADHRLRLERIRGQADPPQGWMATGYHRKVENDALAARWTGRGGRLATIISLDREIASPRVRIRNGRFDVTLDRQTLTID